MFVLEPADTAAAAQQVPSHGEGDAPVGVAIEPELTLGELTHAWTLGVGSDRSLGRPKEWKGESSGFDNFDARACSALVSLTENLLSSKAANGNCRG